MNRGGTYLPPSTGLRARSIRHKLLYFTRDKHTPTPQYLVTLGINDSTGTCKPLSRFVSPTYDMNKFHYAIHLLRFQILLHSIRFHFIH